MQQLSQLVDSISINDLLYIALTMLVLALGIFVQAAAGFAGGMLVIPMLLMMGYGVPEASAALMVATVPQNLVGAYSLRESIDVRSLIWPGVGRVVFFPVGLYVLSHLLINYSSNNIRQIVGAFVLLMTLLTISFRPKPKEHLHPVWAWIAFPASGFLQGVVGMGGPAMVIWVSAHDWSAKRMRAFLFGMYSISLIPVIGLLALQFDILLPSLIAIAALPLLILATRLGLNLGNRLGRRRLRQLTLLLLLVMGVSGILAPWLRPGAATPNQDDQAALKSLPADV